MQLSSRSRYFHTVFTLPQQTALLARQIEATASYFEAAVETLRDEVTFFTLDQSFIRFEDCGMLVRELIISQVERVAREQDKKITAFTDDTVLLDSGLDSLCFAVLVARLEDELGLDPFSDTEATTHPVTFGDLVRVYENARLA